VVTDQDREKVLKKVRQITDAKPSKRWLIVWSPEECEVLKDLLKRTEPK